jgi:hypothetical protein
VADVAYIVEGDKGSWKMENGIPACLGPRPAATSNTTSPTAHSWERVLAQY